MTNEPTLNVPRRLLFGAGFRDAEGAIRYGVLGIEHMCQHLGLDDLGDTEVLDVGCGFSFSQALINRSLPIRRYVGIDVNEDMVEFLRRNVDDPRFEYHHMHTQNEMYNPDGEPLTETTELPIGARQFDLICLFSVFTHMAPDDYLNMLKILRRYVKRDGRLFFTLFIDELTEAGNGLMDTLAQKPGSSFVGKIDTFLDVNPDKRLDWAVYSERFARSLVEEAGWTALSLSSPEADPSTGAAYVQHHFVCAPG